MSSYLHDAKHFQSALSATIQLMNKSQFYFNEQLRVRFGDKLKDEKFITTQFDTIIELSVICVTYQYDGFLATQEQNREINLAYNDAKRKVTPVKLTPLGLFKALQSIDYQIELHHLAKVRELTQAQNDGYFFLKELTNTVANHICQMLASYDDEKWSIS